MDKAHDFSIVGKQSNFFHEAASLYVSSFFPANALTRTILDTLVDLLFGVFGQIDDFDIPRIVFSEHRRAELQTRVAVNAFRNVNNRFSHPLRHFSLIALVSHVLPSIPGSSTGLDSLFGKRGGNFFAQFTTGLNALIIGDILYL